MPKVFFIGDVALDEYYQADYFPKIKEKVIVRTLPSRMGGSIANAACVFAALKNKPYFLTALNSGAVTHTLIEGLNEAGINTDYMVYDNQIPDSKCIIILAENEHTVFIPTLSLQKLEVDEGTLMALCESDFIYTNFCEIQPLCCGNETAFDVLKRIKSGKTQIWCDLDCGDLSDEETELFPYVDVAFINEKGARRLELRYGAAWRSVLFGRGVRLIIVTKAGEGCSLYEKDKGEICVKGIPVNVCDVTGAGDTFCSSFLHAYTRCGDLKVCAEFANYAAARAVTGMGARYGAVDGEEILKFIREHGGETEKYRKLV